MLITCHLSLLEDIKNNANLLRDTHKIINILGTVVRNIVSLTELVRRSTRLVHDAFKTNYTDKNERSFPTFLQQKYWRILDINF